MGIDDDDRDDDDDDGPDKIPTHHLEFCLLGFCPLGFIPTTTIIIIIVIIIIIRSANWRVNVHKFFLFPPLTHLTSRFCHHQHHHFYYVCIICV